jgi:hypothetical protein
MMHEGFSNEELMNIGSRKVKLDLPISATDINASISFMESEVAKASQSGFSEDELKQLAERKVSGIAAPISSHYINHVPLDNAIAGDIDRALAPLENFLTRNGMRLK